MTRISAASLLMCIVACVAQSAHAVETDTAMVDPNVGNTFTVHVADQFLYDDNLFRLPNYYIDLARLIGPTAVRQDHIDTISTGADGLWTLGSHVVALDLLADYNHYSHNTDLDNSGGSGKLTWNFQAGPILTGGAGASFSRSLANFSNTVLLFTDDEIDQTQYFGSLQLRTGLHWNLIGGLNYADSTHSAFIERFDDLSTRSGNFGAQYVSLLNNTITGVYQYTQGIFADGGPERRFRDSTETVKLDYTFGADTLLDASAGHQSHDSTAAYSSFGGSIWDVKLQWHPAPKTGLGVEVWRRLTAYAEAQSDYFVARGYSLSPTWQPREKIKLSLVFLWDKHQFFSSYDVPITTIQRRDDINSQQLMLTYSPRKVVTMNLSYTFQKRVSDIAEFTYDDRLAAVSVTVNF